MEFDVPFHRQDKNSSLLSLDNAIATGGEGNQRETARVLMGVFCRETESDDKYRSMFRMLFGIHPFVCSLGRFEQEMDSNRSSRCRLIYTFVAGRNHTEDDTPTRLLDESIPILRKHQDDQVILNIKENMNDGKTETWLYYAKTLMDKKGLDFDYVGKMDTDTMIHLREFFQFADENLHPHPYNQRTIAGSFYDKAWWAIRNSSKEKFFEDHYPGVQKPTNTLKSMHLYPCGQLYIISKDLVHGIVEVAQNGTSLLEGIEDHDIGTMAYISAGGKPMNLILLSKKMQFWEHPVKRYRKTWKEKWRNEINNTIIEMSEYNITTPPEVELFLRISILKSDQK